jgi:hypothetical protein
MLTNNSGAAMKRVSILFAALLAAACTSPVNEWVAVNHPLAVHGQMKWSEYYTQLFDQVAQSHVANKGTAMERANLMIQGAQKYEAGTMSKENFFAMQRMAQEWEAKEAEAQQRRSNMALGQALQNVGEMYKKAPIPTYNPPPVQSYTTKPPVQTNCTTYGNQISCTSQ